MTVRFGIGPSEGIRDETFACKRVRRFQERHQAGAHFNGYIGHDEPATLFYSNQAGSGNNVSWNLVLPKEPPTAVTQTGSGGTEYGPLRVVNYPTAPFGTVTKRFNDFRSNPISNPCPAS